MFFVHITIKSLVGVLPNFETALDLEALGIEQISHLFVVDLQHAEGHLSNTSCYDYTGYGCCMDVSRYYMDLLQMKKE